MSLANLFNVPKTREELLSWASAHASNHRDILRRIYELGQVALPEYVLEPIDPNNLSVWAYQHQIMHNQMNALVGVNGFNLTSPDFNNMATLPDWIQLNANEHVRVNELLGVGTSGDLPPTPPQVVTATFQSNAQSAAGGTSYSFPGLAFGTPAANRYIVVGVAFRGPFASFLTGVTIGGVAAGLLVRTTASVGVYAALVIALVPTGLTGTVDVNIDSPSQVCSVAVYSLTGVASAAAAVVAQKSQTTPPVVSAPLDVAENGAVIAVATVVAGAPPVAVWTNLTEDCDNNYGPGNFIGRSSASRNFTSQQFAVPCRVAFSAGNGCTACYAVFNP